MNPSFTVTKKKYKRSDRWDTKTNTRCFLSAAEAYQYHIFMYDIDVNLHQQHLDHHICYQAQHVIYPDDEDV